MSKFVFATALSAVLLVASAETGYSSSWDNDSGVKDSDPHLNGSRDMNYDHVIVPGTRIGPVYLKGRVEDAVQHLGEPDRVDRSTFRGPGYDADEVRYWYTDECIDFFWADKGVEPLIENGWRGINVTCDKWNTVSGLHVGSTVHDVVSNIGEYCTVTTDDGTLKIATKDGIWFIADNRNSPVRRIMVVPSTGGWNAFTGCT